MAPIDEYCTHGRARVFHEDFGDVFKLILAAVVSEQDAIYDPHDCWEKRWIVNLAVCGRALFCCWDYCLDPAIRAPGGTYFRGSRPPRPSRKDDARDILLDGSP